MSPRLLERAVRNAVLLLSCSWIAACADPAPAPTQARSSASPAAATPPAAPHATASADAGDAAAQLVLDGDGLRVFSRPSGSSRLIAFGIPAAEATAMLSAARNRAPVDQGGNDCGTTQAAWPDGLTVWFANDRFVGWALRPDAVNQLATAANLRIGATRAELESAYAAQIGQTTLGTEFSAGNMAGVLSSDAADARVTHLWAGETCIAR